MSSWSNRNHIKDWYYPTAVHIKISHRQIHYKEIICSLSFSVNELFYLLQFGMYFKFYHQWQRKKHNFTYRRDLTASPSRNCSIMELCMIEAIEYRCTQTTRKLYDLKSNVNSCFIQTKTGWKKERKRARINLRYRTPSCSTWSGNWKKNERRGLVRRRSRDPKSNLTGSQRYDYNSSAALRSVMYQQTIQSRIKPKANKTVFQ